MAAVQVCPNPACRTENPADHLYCYACGTRLAGAPPRPAAATWGRGWLLVCLGVVLLIVYAVLTEGFPW